MNLTDFLLARIAEDEDVARGIRPHEYLSTRDDRELTSGDRGGYLAVCVTSGRVLAECEAKRRIVHEYEVETSRGPAGERADFVARHGGILDAYTVTLRLVALPYADHPDYREEWRS